MWYVCGVGLGCATKEYRDGANLINMVDHPPVKGITSKATRLFLPSWWIRAFDETCRTDDMDVDAIGLSMRSGLSPALKSSELGVAGIMLSQLQEQLLKNNPVPYRLRIDPHEYYRQCGSKCSNQQFMLGRALQQVTHLKLLVREDTSNIVRTIPIFVGENLDYSDFSINLEISPLGSELLLGYADCYNEFVRFLTSSQEATNVLRSTPPLGLWRSIWLDLQGPEQVILLRLEKASQWDFRILQLEGAFGVSIESLFDGLHGLKGFCGTRDQQANQKSIPAESLFVRRLKFLVRLGRKMAEHGLISARTADQYMAFSKESSQDLPQVVWQTHRDRFFAEEADEYLRKVTTFFAKSHLNTTWSDCSRFLLAGLPDITLNQRISDYWRRIHGYTSTSPLVSQKPAAVFSKTHLLLTQPLFIEWCIRQVASHKFPLPPSLASSDAGRLARFDDSTPVEQRFDSFCKVVLKNADYGQVLEKTPLASLVSPITRTVPQLKQELLASCLTAKERLPTIAAIPPATSPNLEGHSTSKNTAIGGKQPFSHSHTNEATTSKPKADDALSNAVIARMRKLATEELRRMRINNETGYITLKKLYFSSLDETGKKLVLEVQQRMQPEIFANHLNHRLVRFMVENPSSWKSFETKTISREKLS